MTSSNQYKPFFRAADMQSVMGGLKNREQLLAAVVFNTPECVKLIDVHGTLLDMNDAGLALIEADDWESVAGANVYSLMAPEHLGAFREFNESVCAGEERSLEFEIIALKGTRRWMQSTAVPFQLPGGELVHLAITREITNDKLHELELQSAKDCAEAASRTKSEFLANMSHELRTPMTAILGFTEVLLDESQSDRAVEFCDIIRRNGEQLLEIINDILDLSRVESGKLEADRSWFNLAELLEDIYSLMRIRAEAKGLQWLVQRDPQVPDTIYSDPTRLRQILMNLVGNAIKFTESGSVRLECKALMSSSSASGCVGTIEFSVEDTGPGIPADQQTRLFEPFVQVDNSVTRKYGGSGLGLAISQRLTDVLQGQLLCQSELGKGTRFTLSLPVESGHQDDQSEFRFRSDRSEVLPDYSFDKALEGCRILLVEDGPDNQKLICHILRKAGGQVEVAANGQDALDVIFHSSCGQQAFDIVLMDMQMPVVDGYTATRELRARGYTAPIIALTAHAMVGDEEHCISVGCSSYLTKPVDHRRLIDTLRSQLHCYKKTGQVGGANKIEN